MHKFITVLLDWSEVWPILLPILVMKKQPAVYRPVVFYVWAALVIDLAADVLWKIKHALPPAWQSNNYLYNIHSIVRFYLFSSFFIRLKQPFLMEIKKGIPVLFTIFLVINFAFCEQFFNYWQFSSRLLAVEAFCLLFYTLQYYLYKINEDLEVNIFTPDVWIISGLGIYVSINFFIFMLYNELTRRVESLAVGLWNIHNISFIIFNLFLAKGFYESRRQR